MAKSRRGRGEGSIFQRSDGRWVAVATDGLKPNGKPNRKYLYGATKGAAQKKLWMWNLGKRDMPPRAGQVSTLSEHLDAWVAHRQCDLLTRDRYQQQVNTQVRPRIGDIRLDRLEVSHIQLVCSEMTEAGASNDAVARVIRFLRLALDDLGGRNPAKDVPIPRHQRSEIHPMTVGQVLALLEAAREDRYGLYPLYLLAVDSGMRQGELFGLQWDDIDWQGNALSVQRSVMQHRGKLHLKPPKTKAGRRRIDLSSKTINALREHQAAAKPGSVFVFPTPLSKAELPVWRRSNFHNRSWLPLLKRAGLPRFRFHDLRHTCATLLLLAGENPKVISERLGHSNVTVTLSIYAHVLPAMQQSAARKMESLFERS